MADEPITPTGEEPEGGSAEAGTATGESEENEPKLTQRQFDFELARRLKDERAKFSDYDDLQAKASRLDEIEESRKDEQTKLAERAEKAEATASDALSKAHRIIRKAAVVSAAARAGVDSETVHALLLARDFRVESGEQTVEITVADDGETVIGAEEAVAALVAEKGLAGTRQGDDGGRQRFNVDPGTRQDPPAKKSPEDEHKDFISGLLSGRAPQT